MKVVILVIALLLITVEISLACSIYQPCLPPPIGPQVPTCTPTRYPC